MTSAVNTQLEALHALARAAAGGEFRARTLLQRICAAIGDALEFERVAIFRYVAETDLVIPFAARGAAEAEVIRVPPAIPLDRLPTFRAARSSGHAVFVRDARGEEAFSELAIELFGLHSLVIVPLISEGRCLGFMCADRSGKDFALDDMELELLTTIGTFTAAFLDRAIEQSELRRLNELKSQFIALASHELRTPAASIYGISATIDERWEALSPEHRDQLRRVLHQQADRLRRLVEQLLDLSQIEAEAIRILPTRIRIAAHLNELVDSVASDLREGVTIDVAPELEAVIDPVAFDRILSNLVVKCASLRRAARMRSRPADEGPVERDGRRPRPGRAGAIRAQPLRTVHTRAHICPRSGSRPLDRSVLRSRTGRPYQLRASRTPRRTLHRHSSRRRVTAKPVGVQKLSQPPWFRRFVTRSSQVRVAAKSLDRSAETASGNQRGLRSIWRRPVDLILARARVNPDKCELAVSVESTRACDVVGAETDRVSGCVFVLVDQPAEQVPAV